MNLPQLLLLLGSGGFVLWFGQRIPLTGWRKLLVIGCRMAAIGALSAALLGTARHRTAEIPRHLVYLVDRSTSIDASQQEWIARRIASLEALRPSQVDRALVAFGGEPAIIMPFSHERLTDPAAIQQALDQVDVRPGEPNLEAALLAIPGLLPPEHRGSVVLFSDGRETAGNVTGVASAIRRFGLEVFPISLPTFGEAKTVWEGLVVPPVVQRGSPVAIQLVVMNGASTPKQAHVAISMQGVEIKRRRVLLRPGWQVVNLEVPAIGRGTLELEVELTIPEEGRTERHRAYTEVEGEPRILWVAEQTPELPALAAALKRREMEIAITPPADLPIDAGGQRDAGGVRTHPLLDYDAVVLFNLPKSALSDPQVEVLRSYVEQFGGGLIMIGLGGDLAHEIQTLTPLDALLPLQFEPKGLQEAKRRICMILLIDRSASMLGPRIAATKRAAVAFVKQLAPEDLVGILAFDTKPYVVVEVQQAGQIDTSLVDKLVKLRSSGGTDIFPALMAAANRLELTDATLKHILLLSDGNTPFRKPAYDALVESFKEEQITVSTIGIGSAFINRDYLEWLATSTGGTYYPMRKLDELPQLIARDTQQELERLPFTEGHFQPSRSPTSDWFRETTEWPPLRGFLTTTAKSGSQVDLTVDGGDGPEPLLARWQRGRGRVVSFASDADRRWSPSWVRWPGFEGMWAQVVRWTMRPRMTEELFVWIDESPDVPRLVVEGLLHDPRGELVSADGNTTIPLALIQTGSWRWHASLEQVPSGWYQLALEAKLPVEKIEPMRLGQVAASAHDQPTVFVKRWVQVGTPPTTQEIAGQPPRESLLRHLARATSGAYDTPDLAMLPPTTTTVTEPLLTWWLPIVIFALLVDIAIRGSSML